MTEHARSFDAVSSIEMGEHVGEEQYPAYVGDPASASLRPGGRLLLQQMSRGGTTAPGGGAFIESYIAPDMHMRPLWRDAGVPARTAGFEIRDVRGDAGALRADRRALAGDARAATATSSSRCIGEEVARVWRLYLVGGALAFERGPDGRRPDPGGQVVGCTNGR